MRERVGELVADRPVEGEREAQLGRAQGPGDVAGAVRPLPDAVEDARGDLVRALPADVAGAPGGVDELAARHVDEEGLVGSRMGDEAPRAAGDDAELDARPPRG